MSSVKNNMKVMEKKTNCDDVVPPLTTKQKLKSVKKSQLKKKIQKPKENVKADCSGRSNNVGLKQKTKFHIKDIVLNDDFIINGNFIKLNAQNGNIYRSFLNKLNKPLSCISCDEKVLPRYMARHFKKNHKAENPSTKCIWCGCEFITDQWGMKNVHRKTCCQVNYHLSYKNFTFLQLGIDKLFQEKEKLLEYDVIMEPANNLNTIEELIDKNQKLLERNAFMEMVRKTLIINYVTQKHELGVLQDNYNSVYQRQLVLCKDLRAEIAEQKNTIGELKSNIKYLENSNSELESRHYEQDNLHKDEKLKYVTRIQQLEDQIVNLETPKNVLPIENYASNYFLEKYYMIQQTNTMPIMQTAPTTNNIPIFDNTPKTAYPYDTNVSYLIPDSYKSMKPYNYNFNDQTIIPCFQNCCREFNNKYFNN